MRDVDRSESGVLVEDERRDQVAAQEEEDGDAETAWNGLAVAGVGDHHDQHGQCAQPVQRGDRAWLRPRRRLGALVRAPRRPARDVGRMLTEPAACTSSRSLENARATRSNYTTGFARRVGTSWRAADVASHRYDRTWNGCSARGFRTWATIRHEGQMTPTHALARHGGFLLAPILLLSGCPGQCDPAPPPAASPAAAPDPAPVPPPPAPPTEAPTPTGPPGGPGCGFASAAFCEDFQGPRNTSGNRNGDLSTARFSVSRWRSEASDDGNQHASGGPAPPATCGSRAVAP